MSEEGSGQLVGGRYRLAEPLGRGGVGVVWRAIDELLQREVAVKEIRFPASIPDRERDDVRARVMREARAAARLSHPSVTAVYDVIADADAGTAFLVMELVRAPSLAELVRAEGTLSPQRAATIGLQVLDALQVAHGAGIVHRDVKPSNIMVPASGPAKLADFGIASVAGDVTITTTGLILGSPSFMAPEQANGSASGPPVDLWGLGASLYFAVEGRPPFDRGQPLPTLSAVLHEPHEPPAAAGALAPVIDGLLEKDFRRRLTAEQARRRLQEATVEATDHTDVSPSTTMRLPHRAARAPAAAAAATTGRRRRSLPAMLPIAGILLVAALGLGLAAMLGSRDGTPPDEGQVAEGSQPGEGDAQQGNSRTGGSGRKRDKPAPTEATEEPTEATEEPTEATEEPTEAGEEPTEPAGEPGRPAPPPDGWQTFTVEDTGASVAFPPGWEVVPRDGTRTDLRDPDSGTYMRVDYTDDPGDDPVAAWEEQSESFDARHDNYREIGIEPFDFRGDDAALWEYTYSDGGADLHAYNLGLVAGDYGYALNFQTRDEDFDDNRDLFVQMVRTFDPGD
ncbi:MAG: serine/threonine protein kinase [Euzebyales bacterium]|nr:serine/threonine protein kinase [Euzebyales bacterium]